MTVVDPATGFFETVEIGENAADMMANWLELHWLSRYPWPTEITMDKGREFATSREVNKTLINDCDISGRLLPVVIHNQTP